LSHDLKKKVWAVNEIKAPEPALIEEEDLSVEEPQFFTSLSEEPTSRPIGNDVFKKIVEMSNEMDTDEAEQMAKAIEKRKKLKIEYFPDIGLSAESVAADMVDVYPEQQGSIEGYLRKEENNIGGIYVNVLYVNGSIFGEKDGYIFELSDTYELDGGIRAQLDNEDIEDGCPADSFNYGGDHPTVDDMKRNIHNIKEVQKYAMKNARYDVLKHMYDDGFFDEFVKKDSVLTSLKEAKEKKKKQLSAPKRYLEKGIFKEIVKMAHEMGEADEDENEDD